MATAQGPQGGGGTTSNTSNQSQNIELQGIVANGVLGGLPVAEQNQEYFIVFKGVGGTGPEIIAQTAYFIEYLVDSDGNIFKPTENTSALNNLLQNFPIQKPVNVILDNASNASSNLGGKIELTAVGLQTPILYSQTGSSAGAFTGSLFFKGDPTLGVISNDGTLTIPDMTAFMEKTTLLPSSQGLITGYNSFVGGTPSDASGNARSASLATGRYIVTSSALGDIQTFTLQSTVRVRNPTSSPKDLSLSILENGNSLFGGGSFIIPANSEFQTLINTQQFTSQFAINNLPDGEFLQLALFQDVDELDFAYIRFGCVGGTFGQNPDTNGDLLQDAGLNSPPFWTTGSGGSLYITASSYLSQNYGNTQLTEGSIQMTGGTINIGTQFTDFNLSKIQTPFKVKVGDRIRFLYNPSTDFHIYDVKEPQDEEDGFLKLKLNTVPSQSFTETQLSNFVLHRTNETIPRYIILNVDKPPGIVDTTENPFTGVILPQFPSEKLLNNLDSILNKLKVEGIIEN
jgi:hypothetical protein